MSHLRSCVDAKLPEPYHTLSFVLASTQDLHEKISELCSRVRELEDALREAHVRLSPPSPQGHPPQQHPLLTEDLLRIKMPLQRETPSERYGNGIKEEPADVVDSFGSLSIGQSGRTKYYGHVANSWVRVFWQFHIFQFRSVSSYLLLRVATISTSCRCVASRDDSAHALTHTYPPERVSRRASGRSYPSTGVDSPA